MLPSGWPSNGDALGLVTDVTVDGRGRPTEVLGPAHSINGTSVRRADWTVYDDDGGLGEASSQVRVVSSSEAILSMMSLVEEMGLRCRVERRLLRTLWVADFLFNRGRNRMAVIVLRIFNNQVRYRWVRSSHKLWLLVTIR